MKVLENNKKESWKIVCLYCNSILEYDQNDVIKKESYFFYLHYIKCPCCKNNIDVIHW
jgi:hypothetical protein